MNGGRAHDLLRRAEVIVLLEIVFGWLTYKILAQPYNGDLWPKLVFWISLVVSTVAFALNLKLGWLTLRSSRQTKNRNLVLVLFILGFLYVIALNFAYWANNPK